MIIIDLIIIKILEIFIKIIKNKYYHIKINKMINSINYF